MTRDPFSLLTEERSLSAPTGIQREEVQLSLRNVRHLTLGVRITAELFEDSFLLMPNITSPNLTFDQFVKSDKVLFCMTNLGNKLVKLAIWSPDDRLVKSRLDLFANSLRDLDLEARFGSSGRKQRSVSV